MKDFFKRKKMSDEKNETPVEKQEVSPEHTKAEVQKDLPGIPTDEKEKRIAELEEQLAAINDKYIRLYSEFDNFRKRTAKERIEILSMAGADVIKNLLPVVDDLDRAIANNEKTADAKAMNEGIVLIAQKFKSMLGKNGLEPMDSKGKIFDSEIHEAVTNIPAPTEDLKGKVVEEIEKGYLLNGKVIRFAKVIVGS
ncbi:MAG: nucleotide exchange factor GrpE [Bacteroidetes bacterium]|nr:nucleotide exchange factor GrpE [Bacteroidota bacterium]